MKVFLCVSEHAWFFLPQCTDLLLMFWRLGRWVLAYFGKSLLRLKCFRSLVEESHLRWTRNHLKCCLEEYFARRFEVGLEVGFYCAEELRLVGRVQKMILGFTGSRFCLGWVVFDVLSSFLMVGVFCVLFMWKIIWVVTVLLSFSSSSRYALVIAISYRLGGLFGVLGSR